MFSVDVPVEIGDLDEDVGISETVAKHVMESYDLGGINFPVIG